MSRGVSFIQMVGMMALCEVLLLATLQQINSMKVPTLQQKGEQVQEDAEEEIQKQKETLTSWRSNAGTNLDGKDSPSLEKFKKKCSEKKGKGGTIVDLDMFWVCSGETTDFQIKRLHDCQRFCWKATHWKYCKFYDSKGGSNFCVCTNERYRSEYKDWESTRL